MANLNRVMLIGRVGQKNEVRYTGSGKAVTNFSLATSETWTDRNGQKTERTEWHRIVAWGKLAEICASWLDKGRLIYVEGSIRSRKFQDSAGQEKTAYEIVANEVIFLSSPGGAQAQAYPSAGLSEPAPSRPAPPPPPSAQAIDDLPPDDDDIPPF